MQYHSLVLDTPVSYSESIVFDSLSAVPSSFLAVPPVRTEVLLSPRQLRCTSYPRYCNGLIVIIILPVNILNNLK
jgi:hypothetical protein